MFSYLDNCSKLTRWLLLTLGWAFAIGLLWYLDLLSKFAERTKVGAGLSDFRLIVEQITSALAVFIMLLFVIFWQKRVALMFRPFSIQYLAAHLLGFSLFAIGHYALLERMRWGLYSHLNYYYVNDNYLSNLVFEAQKDFKIYLGLVVVISLYRHYQFKVRAEKVKNQHSPPQNVLLMAGRGEKVVAIDKIQYLQAARNYVIFHVGEKEYLARDTLANCIEKLPLGVCLI